MTEGLGFDKDGVPFGKTSAACVIFFAAICESSDALRHGLPICVVQRSYTQVNLDAEYDSLLLEKFRDGLASGRILKESLFIQDHTTDVLSKPCEPIKKHGDEIGHCGGHLLQ